MRHGSKRSSRVSECPLRLITCRKGGKTQGSPTRRDPEDLVAVATGLTNSRELENTLGIEDPEERPEGPSKESKTPRVWGEGVPSPSRSSGFGLLRIAAARDTPACL